MRSCQAERLATENAEEREVRLQHDRESHREWRVQETLGQLHLPLIQQRAVQAKMQKFHVHVAALEVSPTHRINCLPFLTWSDTGLGGPHPVCDRCFFYMSIYGHLD